MTILLNTSWLTLPSSSIRIYSVLSDYSSSMVSMIIHSFPIAGKTFGLTSNSQNIDSGCLELSWKKETGCFQVQQELVPWMTLLEIRKWWYDMSFLRLTAPPTGKAIVVCDSDAQGILVDLWSWSRCCWTSWHWEPSISMPGTPATDPLIFWSAQISNKNLTPLGVLEGMWEAIWVYCSLQDPMAAHGIPCDTANHCDVLSLEAVMVHVYTHTTPRNLGEVHRTGDSGSLLHPQLPAWSWEYCWASKSLRFLICNCDHAAEVRTRRLDLFPSQLLDAQFL